MSFAQDNGYIPRTFEEIMNAIRLQVNDKFSTSYTEQTFIGTSWYKYLYGPVQEVQKGEIKTAEVFQKLQQFIALTNEEIQRPSVSYPGLVDSFDSKGFVSSIKKPELIDAGTISICVNVDHEAADYATKKLQINTNIKEFVAAGMISTGDQISAIVIENGQTFDFAFHLPDKQAIKLRMTAVKSENNLLTIPNDTQIRQTIFNNINSRYRLGWNFEPQRYYNLTDAPWAQSVLLEYSTNDGATWASVVHDAAFTDLFTFALGDIQVLVS